MVIMSVFLKIDYRFVDEIVCCGDDHDYYLHAETIALDFDFDYKNQFENIEKIRFIHDGKKAPKGFVGPGILSAPFLFIGNLFDKLIVNNSLYNFRILFYSFSSLFYLFLSVNLMTKTLKLMKIKYNFNHLLLFYLGSGVTYFAFERYSMSHVYEVFTASLVLYLSAKYYSNDKSKKYAVLIPLSIMLALLVRWVNYYVIFLPLVAKLFMRVKNDKILFKDRYFYISSILSLLIFSFMSYQIYGVITFDPQFVYQNTYELSGFVNEFFDPANFIIEKLKFFFIILFSKEFGVFWFSPIIFLSTIISFKYFYSRFLDFKFFIPLMFLQVYALVIIWNSTASSYGFRYLYCLIPFSVLLYFYTFKDNENKIFLNYLIYFSIFSSLSILFFETSEITSLRENINSFGSLERFSQPEYLVGYIKSLVNFDSYLKIFTTSFLGALSFKLLLILLGIDRLNEILTSLNLPVGNQDFQDFLIDINTVETLKIFLTFFILYLFSSYLLKTQLKVSESD